MLDYDLLVHAPAHYLWLLAQWSLVVSCVRVQMYEKENALNHEETLLIYFKLLTKIQCFHDIL